MSGLLAVITGAGSATPPSRTQSELWEEFFGAHFGGGRWERGVFENAGAARRHCAVDPVAEDISQWSTGQRMARYVTEALPLGKEAVTAALAASGLDAADIGLLTVVSCTGYATPGIDIHLVIQKQFYKILCTLLHCDVQEIMPLRILGTNISLSR